MIVYAPLILCHSLFEVVILVISKTVVKIISFVIFGFGGISFFPFSALTHNFCYITIVAYQKSHVKKHYKIFSKTAKRHSLKPRRFAKIFEYCLMRTVLKNRIFLSLPAVSTGGTDGEPAGLHPLQFKKRRPHRSVAHGGKFLPGHHNVVKQGNPRR